MNTTIIEIGRTRGAIFEGELPDSYCFVPENCIREEHGEATIAETDYVRSHWDERNMRMSSAAEGKRLFPKPGHPVNNIQSYPVQKFLVRLRQAWSDFENFDFSASLGDTSDRPVRSA